MTYTTEDMWEPVHCAKTQALHCCWLPNLLDTDPSVAWDSDGPHCTKTLGPGPA